MTTSLVESDHHAFGSSAAAPQEQQREGEHHDVSVLSNLLQKTVDNLCRCKNTTTTQGDNNCNGDNDDEGGSGSISGTASSSWCHETAAALVVDSMTTPGRVYHSVQHVLDIVDEITSSSTTNQNKEGGAAAVSKEEEEAILILAALFHDVIYLTIDERLSRQQEEILCGIIKILEATGDKNPDAPPGAAFVVHNLPSEDPGVNLVRRLFGYSSTGVSNGDAIVRAGHVNEYLSALIAVRVLSRIPSPQQQLDFKRLIQVTACIEASIPFRPADKATDRTAMDVLSERLDGLIDDDNDDILPTSCCSPLLNDTQREATIRIAARFANCDVGVFGTADRDKFLTTSWRLLPEWNPKLLGEHHTFEDWYDALLLLMQRYPKVNVMNIFQSFGGVPDADELDAMRRRARENLAFVGHYAAVRLLTVHWVRASLQRLLFDSPEQNAATSCSVQECIFSKFPSTAAFLGHLDECIDPSWVAVSVPPSADGSNTNAASSSSPPLSSSSVTTKPQWWREQVHDCLIRGRREGFEWDARSSRLSAYLYAHLDTDPADLVSRLLLLQPPQQRHDQQRSKDNDDVVSKALPEDVSNKLCSILSDALSLSSSK